MKYRNISFAQIAAMLKEHAFVYCPNRGNLGDFAIAYATYLFFERFFNGVAIPVADEAAQDQVLVLGGGGGLVDGLYTAAWDVVLRHLVKGGRVIVLPHTVVGFHEQLIQYQNQIQIICREPRTYDGLVGAGFPEQRLFLGQDMAFYLADDDRYLEAFKARAESGAVLRAFRQDKEMVDPERSIEMAFDVSALAFGMPMSKLDAWNGVGVMLNIIAMHDVVVTDRLHVAILSSLLGHQCYILENSYYKNRAIYEHSIQGKYSQTKLVSGWGDVPEDIRSAPTLMPFLRNVLIDYSTVLVGQKEIARKLKDTQRREKKHRKSLVGRSRALIGTFWRVR